MSKMIVFLIKDKVDYSNAVLLSKKIVSYCLDKNMGAIFNFLGYSQSLICEFNPSLYFSISDDFLQLNSEYLNTSKIERIMEGDGKKEFCERFSFLDDVCKILSELGVCNIKLIISAGSENIDDFIIVHGSFETITEVLYKSIIENAEKYAYDFPDIVVDFANEF